MYVKEWPKTSANSLKGHHFTYFGGPGTYLLPTRPMWEVEKEAFLSRSSPRIAPVRVAEVTVPEGPGRVPLWSSAAKSRPCTPVRP